MLLSATSRYLGVLVLFWTTNRSDKDVFDSLVSIRKLPEGCLDPKRMYRSVYRRQAVWVRTFLP